MTDNEKRIVAEWCEPKPQYKPKDDPELSKGGHWVAGYEGIWIPGYRYNTRDACAEFERVVFDRGLRREYGAALLTKCCATGVRFEYFDKALIGFIGANATPAQRVEAILAVIEETRE